MRLEACGLQLVACSRSTMTLSLAHIPPIFRAIALFLALALGLPSSVFSLPLGERVRGESHALRVQAGLESASESKLKEALRKDAAAGPSTRPQEPNDADSLKAGLESGSAHQPPQGGVGARRNVVRKQVDLDKLQSALDSLRDAAADLPAYSADHDTFLALQEIAFLLGVNQQPPQRFLRWMLEWLTMNAGSGPSKRPLLLVAEDRGRLQALQQQLIRQVVNLQIREMLLWPEFTPTLIKKYLGGIPLVDVLHDFIDHLLSRIEPLNAAYQSQMSARIVEWARSDEAAWKEASQTWMDQFIAQKSIAIRPPSFDELTEAILRVGAREVASELHQTGEGPYLIIRRQKPSHARLFVAKGITRATAHTHPGNSHRLTESVDDTRSAKRLAGIFRSWDSTVPFLILGWVRGDWELLWFDVEKEVWNHYRGKSVVEGILAEIGMVRPPAAGLEGARGTFQIVRETPIDELVEGGRIRIPPKDATGSPEWRIITRNAEWLSDAVEVHKINDWGQAAYGTSDYFTIEALADASAWFHPRFTDLERLIWSFRQLAEKLGREVAGRLAQEETPHLTDTWLGKHLQRLMVGAKLEGGEMLAVQTTPLEGAPPQPAIRTLYVPAKWRGLVEANFKGYEERYQIVGEENRRSAEAELVEPESGPEALLAQGKILFEARDERDAASLTPGLIDRLTQERIIQPGLGTLIVIQRLRAPDLTEVVLIFA